MVKKSVGKKQKNKKTTRNREKPLMECGHVALGTSNGKPVCPICFGINPGATEIAKTPPSLEGRKAKCDSCKKVKTSSITLPFFEYIPNKEYDSYYCGCRGWD